MTYRSLRLVHPFFPFTEPQILYFTMLFNRPDTPKAPLPVEASTFPCNTCSLDAPRLSIRNCISIGSAVFAHLTADSLYTLQCALKRAIKGLIAGINAIEKLIVLQPYSKLFLLRTNVLWLTARRPPSDCPLLSFRLSRLTRWAYKLTCVPYLYNYIISAVYITPNGLQFRDKNLHSTKSNPKVTIFSDAQTEKVGTRLVAYPSISHHISLEHI